MGNNNTTSQLVVAEVEEEVVEKKLGVKPENPVQADAVYDEDNGMLEMNNDGEDDEKNTEDHFPSSDNSAHLITENTSLFNTQEFLSSSEQAGGVSDEDAAENTTLEEEEEEENGEEEEGGVSNEDAAETSIMEEEEENDDEEGRGVSDEDAAETTTMEEQEEEEESEETSSGGAALLELELELELEDDVNNTLDHDKLLDLAAAGGTDEEELFENNKPTSPHLIKEPSPFKVVPSDDNEETSDTFLGPAAAAGGTSDDDGDVGESKTSNCNDIHVLGTINTHGCNNGSSLSQTDDDDDDEVVPADDEKVLIMRSTLLFHSNNEEEEEETEMSDLLTTTASSHHDDPIINDQTHHQSTSSTLLSGDETTTSIGDMKLLQPHTVDMKQQQKEEEVKYCCFIKEDEVDQTINHQLLVFDQPNPSLTPLLETENHHQFSTILIGDLVDQTQTAADTTDNTSSSQLMHNSPSFHLPDDDSHSKMQEEEDSQVLFSSSSESESETESQQQQRQQEDKTNVITTYVFKPDEQEETDGANTNKENISMIKAAAKEKPITCRWLTSSLFRTCICCATSSVINQ